MSSWFGSKSTPSTSKFVAIPIKELSEHHKIRPTGDVIHVRRDKIVSVDYDYELNEATIRIDGYYHFEAPAEEKQRIIAFKSSLDFFQLIGLLNGTEIGVNSFEDSERLSEGFLAKLEPIFKSINQTESKFKVFTVTIPEEVESPQKMISKKLVYALNVDYITSVYRSNQFVHVTEGFKYTMQDKDSAYTYMTVDVFDIYSAMCDQRMASQIMATDLPLELVIDFVN